ncbi:MAG: hypothetical protein NTY94_11390 [Alphaproteobacteria bacterium]|nr:hypothetical protein [Alphaproteobacteria bacterium]
MTRIEAGKNVTAAGYPPTGDAVGIVKVSAVTWGEFNERESKTLPPGADYDPAHRIEAGDFLISRANTVELVGAPVIVRECRRNLVLSDKVLRLRFGLPVERWVERYLKSAAGRRQIEDFSQGAQLSMRNISQDNLRRIRIPMPPQTEMERSVAAMDGLFTDLDTAEAALGRAREGVEQFRASLLHAACAGALTAAWREANPPTETGADLLRRILAERRATWERTEHARLTAKGTPPARGAWKARYVEPVAADMTAAAALPQGWAMAAVDAVGSVQLGRQRAPQYHAGDDMRPYLRVANVFEDRIDISDVMTMQFDAADFEAYRLRQDDILLNEGQSAELVGRPAMFRGELADCCFTNTLVRFRVGPGLLPEFALLMFRSWFRNGTFQRIAKITTNIAHLGAGRFAQLPMPIPPIAEQREILGVARQLLSEVETLGTDLKAQRQQVAQLRQSILHATFTGRLVPQDPDDETAVALLARLRAAPPPARRTRSAQRALRV